jgi:hypothetical protein
MASLLRISTGLALTYKWNDGYSFLFASCMISSHRPFSDSWRRTYRKPSSAFTRKKAWFSPYQWSRTSSTRYVRPRMIKERGVSSPLGPGNVSTLNVKSGGSIRFIYSYALLYVGASPVLALLRPSYAPTPLGARTGGAGCSLYVDNVCSRGSPKSLLFGVVQCPHTPWRGPPRRPRDAL